MIGYLGQEGSYSYFAALEEFKNQSLIPHTNLGRLFYALENDEVTGIVVPFENIKDGTNFDVLGRILRSHYHISKVIQLDVELNVVSRNHNSDNIIGIFATEESINECYQSLKKEFDKYKKNYVRTDRDALNKIKFNESLSSASVVSKYEYLGDLNVIASNVRDSKYNIHKFVYIEKELRLNGNQNRVSIALQPKYNRVGAFYDILHEFVFRNINILKVLSQPMHNENNDVVLYLELQGNFEDSNIKEAIRLAKFKSTFLSILGSYYEE